jgi:hypothetical protein
MSFWLAFPLWPRISSISLYIHWAFVLLLSIVCSVHLLIYSMDCWFSERMVCWAPCIFWLLIPYKMFSWQIFFYCVGCLFILVTISFAVQELSSLLSGITKCPSYVLYFLWPSTGIRHFSKEP